MRTHFIITAISFGALLSQSNAGERIVVPVYSQFDDVVSIEKGYNDAAWYRKTRKKTVPDNVACPAQFVKGSGWVIDFGGKKLLVTAAHTLGLNTCDFTKAKDCVEEEIAIEHCWVEKVKSVDRKAEVLVGGLAYRPEQVAWLRRNGDPIDAVIIMMENNAVFDGLKTFGLAERAPTEFEKVKIAGFPQTSEQQVDELTVSAVDEKQGLLTLNKAVKPGYSGGVVLNDKGEAYGVISGFVGEQTTVLLLSNSMLNGLEWQDPVQCLKRNFKER